ncbi:MAG: heavy-metal-associated domain-containing protein [Anaerolineaceae bacterium]
MSTVQYTIPGISCQHCVHTIVNELSELPGVQSVNADVTSKQVIVTFAPPATEETIVKLLTEINYPPNN